MMSFILNENLGNFRKDQRKFFAAEDIFCFELSFIRFLYYKFSVE